MEIAIESETKIMSPGTVYEIMNKILSVENELDRDKEHFWIIGLNSQNKIKYIDLVHLGALNQCVCQPMEIYRMAVLRGVASVIVVHNHPSGNPAPSSQDRAATKKLMESGEILGIKFIDHVILGRDEFYSFADSGNLI